MNHELLPPTWSRRDSHGNNGQYRLTKRQLSYRNLLIATLLLTVNATAVLAADPAVRFDTEPTVVCQDATPDGFAKTAPNHRLVKATFRVSALVSETCDVDNIEYLYQFVGPTGNIRIVDFDPKTQLGTDVAGNIGVDKKRESTKSLGLNVSGSFENMVRATGVGDLGTKDSVQYHYELKAPKSAVLAAGTVDRGTGVYFKIRPSRDSTLEGAREFQLVMRVPSTWRADLLYLRCDVRDTRHREPRIVSSQRFVIGLYAAGDDEALRAAERLVQTEAILRRTVAEKRHEIERRATPTLIHRLGAMLDIYEPQIPNNWLDRVVFGPTGVVRDSFARRLPDEVEQRVLAYVRAKQHIYQLSGARLLVMALPR